MNYLDGLRAPRSFISDVRSHAALWRRFNDKTGTWPILSITTYAVRFILLITGMVAIVWYGNVMHGWTRHQGGLALVLIVAPVLFAWFIIERMAWNHDLHKAGVSSEKDVWSTDQFPEK